MSLPNIKLPTFPVKLPLSGQDLECQPYLVKQDKILLMAAQEMKPATVARATRDVINSCVLTEGFDAAKAASLDTDYLFMKLRAQSVGEKVDVEITCNNEVSDGEICGHEFEVSIDIDDIRISDHRKEDLEKTIKIDKLVSIILKPTTFNATVDMASTDNSIDENIAILYNSIKMITNGDDVSFTSDFTMDEFKSWCETLDKKTFDSMVDYIENLPTAYIEKTEVCPKCGHEHKLRFDNPMDFF